MFVKVCGLQNEDDVSAAINLGYDAFGMILTEKSRRTVSKHIAVNLAHFAQGKIKSVGVALNYSEIKDIAHHFDYIQLYQYHPIENLIFASGQSPEQSIVSSIFLYDSSRGSGVFEPLPQWVRTLKNPVILAGGLTPENVREVVSEFQPFGVDVSSGVEKNGRKDRYLMEQFIQEVKPC